MVVVDVCETASAAAADLFLRVRPESDFEVLTALRALVKNQFVCDSTIASTGLTMWQLRDLADRMLRARHGVVFFGNGLTSTRGKHMNVAALHTLVAQLNASTKFAAMPMRDFGNEAGADNVLTWLAGFPFGIDFSRGCSRYNPGEFTADDLLQRQEIDAALLIGVDPERTLTSASLEQLRRIPTIVFDSKVTAASRQAQVHITTAATGISAAGTVYRMDKVPLPLRPVLRSPYPTDENVIRWL